jgi:hypothetical protein
MLKEWQMRIFLGILVMGAWLASSTAAWGAGFEMDKAGLTTKYTKGKATQNWLGIASKVKSEWLTMKLTGKFFLADLAETYEDSSSVGTDDLFSNVRADFGFPSLSKDLEVPVSYKWNENYQIYHYGIGYEWRLWEWVKLGVSYTESQRRAGETSSEVYNYRLGQAKVSVKYDLERWRYALSLTRSDKLFPNFVAKPAPTASRYNVNYTSLKYLFDQNVSYQVNERLKLGLGYTFVNTDYYQDRLHNELQNDGTTQLKGKKEGKSNKFSLSGNYQLNEAWKLSGSYGLSDYTGYNGDYATNSFKLEGKYTIRGEWWLAAKLRLTDLCYSGYQPEEGAAEDEDADYQTRFQQVLAVEYCRKLTAFTYNLEAFAKHYDYESASTYSGAGLIGTLTWEWLHLDWYLQAAPQGNLSSRKAKYGFKMEYKF